MLRFVAAGPRSPLPAVALYCSRSNGGEEEEDEDGVRPVEVVSHRHGFQGRTPLEAHNTGGLQGMCVKCNPPSAADAAQHAQQGTHSVKRSNIKAREAAEELKAAQAELKELKAKVLKLEGKGGPIEGPS